MSSIGRKILAPEDDRTSIPTAEEDAFDDDTLDEGGPDDKLRKKHQNSVRWKRWWLKNREAYNEKRRLSAQARSAKARTEKDKNVHKTSKTVETSSAGVKRMRKSASSEANVDQLPPLLPVSRRNSGELQGGVTPAPSISPTHTFRGIMNQHAAAAMAAGATVTPLVSSPLVFQQQVGSMPPFTSFSPAQTFGMLNPLQFNALMQPAKTIFPSAGATPFPSHPGFMMPPQFYLHSSEAPMFSPSPFVQMNSTVPSSTIQSGKNGFPRAGMQ